MRSLKESAMSRVWANGEELVVLVLTLLELVVLVSTLLLDGMEMEEEV